MYNIYGHNKDVDYYCELVKINLEEECEKDLRENNGFLITGAKPLKKALSDPDGIFSSKYGRTVDDIKPNGDRYKCDCGNLRSRSNEGIICPICKTKVKHIDDNFKYTGWLKLKYGHKIINPVMYMTLRGFIGKKIFNNIINYEENYNENGEPIPVKNPNEKNEPFYKIGVYNFIKRFDEILEFYKKKTNTKQKVEYLKEVEKHKDKLFSSCIPVYTTLLRLIKQTGITLEYFDINGSFNNMAIYVARINRNRLKLYKKTIPTYIQALQEEIINVYKDIEKIMSGKIGLIRKMYGGRYNFVARDVIRPDSTLKMDQIKLSYTASCKLLEQPIVNILSYKHNINLNDAAIMLKKCRLETNYEIISIINSIINNHKYGIPIIINRNPTLEYGSIMQMHMIGIENSYTMSVPPNICPSLQADFDGDQLNIKLIISDRMYKSAIRLYNPRFAMIINRNDGLIYSNFLPAKNSLVLLNNFLLLGRKNYDEDYKKELILYYNKINS